MIAKQRLGNASARVGACLLPLLVGLGAVAGACSDRQAATGSAPDASANADGAPNADAGASDAQGGASLTLSLDPTIDGDSDDVKVTSFRAATMLDATGKTIATATIVLADAVFDLHGVAAGNYFIEVNGDADDPVPTRIDDPTADMTQRVGQNPLRVESAKEATAIDARIAVAWREHARRSFVESAPEFIDKAARAIALVRTQLPACCDSHRAAELGP